MTSPIDRRLNEIQDKYVHKVNALLGEGREDVAQQLADEYFDAAVHVWAHEAIDSAQLRPASRPPSKGAACL